MAKHKRIPISQTTRFEVFKRDKFICQYCGNHPPKVILHVDHIVPVSKGGVNDTNNLATSCNLCNAGKGARLLSSTPVPLAEKAKETKEREAQLKGYNRIMTVQRNRIEREAWKVLDELHRVSEYSVPSKNVLTTKHFVSLLGLPHCLEAAEVAFAKLPRSPYQRFAYFCGICWKKIKRAA